MNEGWRERMLAGVELAASVSWLFMDFAWMEDSTSWAVICAAPTVVCSSLAVAFARPTFSSRAVVAAMAAWSAMNSFWMLADLELVDGLWPARLCFVLGFALLLAAWARGGSLRSLLEELLLAFRRLRSGGAAD